MNNSKLCCLDLKSLTGYDNSCMWTQYFGRSKILIASWWPAWSIYRVSGKSELYNKILSLNKIEILTFCCCYSVYAVLLRILHMILILLLLSVWIQRGRSKSASKASISFSLHFSLSQVEETGLLLCHWPYISSGQTVLVISCLDFVGFPSAGNLRCLPPRTSMWCVLGRQHSTLAAKSEETESTITKRK